MTDPRAQLLALFAAITLGACTTTGGDKTPSAKAPPPYASPIKAKPAAAQTPATRSTFRQEGSGIYIDPKAFAPKAVQKTNEGRMALNFQNAPVGDVIKAIIGDLLGLAYVIDPAISGTMSLTTSGGLPDDALIPALEQALRLHNLALVIKGDVAHVVPADSIAMHTGLPLVKHTASKQAGYAINIFPIKHSSAAEIEKLVKPYVPKTASLTVDPLRNLLILGGNAMARANVGQLIEGFDADWLAGKSLSLRPLYHADAPQLSKELNALFQSDESPAKGLFRFLPMERLNALLVITHSGESLVQVESWISRLDVPGEAAGGMSLIVYPLENSRAKDVAAVLGGIFTGGASIDPNTALPLNAGESETENAPKQAAQNVSFSDTKSGLRVIADDANNALVVLANSTQHQLIKNALKDMDTPPKQVLIEATIAEVTLNDELRFGLQWFFKSGNSNLTLSNASTGSVAPSVPGFNFILDKSANTRVVLDALEDVNDVRVISSPQLMVLNNQTATLQVGDQVPVATRSAVSTQDPNAPTVNTIEFKDTGVILTVHPRVNSGGLVILDISQEVSTVAQTTTSGIDSPTIQQRRIESQVAVQSGETIALGGMIQRSVQSSNSGVPYISKVPLVGSLFKTRRDKEVRTELLVLLSPKVIESVDDARRATLILRQRLKDVEELIRREGF